MRHASRLLVVALLALAPARAQIAFPEPFIAAGGGATDLVGGDIDADGDRDVVSTGGADAYAALLLNDGLGGLATMAATPGFLPGPRRAWMTDLDLDGRLDVLIICSGGSPVDVGGVVASLGDGAGGFLGSTTRVVNGAPRDGAVADIDGDGVPDVATCNANTANAALLIGTGTGALGPPLYLPAGASPVGVALDDFDADGDAELLVANSIAANLWLRANDGKGGYGAATAFDIGATPVALRVVPLDGDALPDALVLCTDDTLRVLRGDGAGGLLAPQITGILPVPQSLEACDVDLDGDLDVVTSHGIAFPIYSPFSLSVLLNDGAGSLTTHAQVSSGYTNGIDLGDFDGDLLPDAAFGRPLSGFTMFRGDGLGGLIGASAVAVGSEAFSVALADVNGDGRPDVLAANSGDGTVTWLPGQPGTTFGTPTVLPASAGNITGDLTVADVTGDGAPDVVTADTDKAQVSLLAGDGAGGFAAPALFACGAEVRAVVTADLDADGTADVVTCNTSSYTVSVLRGGGGTLAPKVDYAAGSHPTALAVGHFDAGGTWDVVTANEFGNDISLLRGDGAGGLLPKVSMPGDVVWVRSIVLADLDDDGDDDAVSVFGNSAVVRLSDGATGFSSKTTASLPTTYAVDAVAADFDVDGALDVAVAHSSPYYNYNRIDVLAGVGNGQLGPPQDYLYTQPLEALASADLDGDGFPDLVGTSNLNSQGYVLRNLTGGPAAWKPLGQALAGDYAPKLAGAGSLLAGSPGALTWFDAPPLAPGALFLAPTSSPLPFKGGTLVPVPPLATLLVVLPADGRLQLVWPAFPAVGSGSTFFFQAAAQDAGAPAGVALSNGLEAVVP